MGRPQFNVATLVLLAAALPIWVALTAVVPDSTGFGSSPFRFVAAPLVLGGMTIAIHRLISQHRCAWGISALIAAVVALGALSLAAWFSR